MDVDLHLITLKPAEDSNSARVRHRRAPRLAVVRWLLTLAGFGSLLACAPAIQFQNPEPDRPTLTLEAQAPVLIGAVDDAALVHWRQFFQDRRLHALIDAALAHNRDLKQATARIEEARAQWNLARAERLPNLNLLGQLALDKTLADGLSFAPRRRLDLGLASAAFELDFFGRLANLSDAAKANFLATEEAKRATELALIGQIAELYHTQRFTEESLERARQQVSSRQRSLQILEQAQQIGVVNDLETEQAHVQLEEARSQRTQLGHMLNQTQNLLRLLVGPRAVAEDLPPGLPSDQLLASPVAQLPVSAEVLLLRPDIVSAERRLQQSQANIKAARAAFFPRIALTASLGTASAGLDRLFSAGAWSFRPTVTLPLFDGGRTQAGLDIAKAREVAAVASYEQTIEAAFREVADQLSARHALSVQASSADRTLQAHQVRLKIHRQRYEAGLAGFLDVLEAERQVLSAEQTKAQIQRARLDAQVGLFRALGGGSPADETAAAGAAMVGAAPRTAAR